MDNETGQKSIEVQAERASKEQFRELLQRMQENDPTLTRLSTERDINHLLSAEESQQLLEALSQNTHLEEVHLTKLAATGEDAAIPISQLIKNNPVLRMLSISDINLGEEGINKINSSLRRNSSLEGIGVTNVGLRSSGYAAEQLVRQAHSSGINLILKDAGLSKNWLSEIKSISFLRDANQLIRINDKDITPAPRHSRLKYLAAGGVVGAAAGAGLLGAEIRHLNNLNHLEVLDPANQKSAQAKGLEVVRTDRIAPGQLYNTLRIFQDTAAFNDIQSIEISPTELTVRYDKPQLASVDKETGEAVLAHDRVETYSFHTTGTFATVDVQVVGNSGKTIPIKLIRQKGGEDDVPSLHVELTQPEAMASAVAPAGQVVFNVTDAHGYENLKEPLVFLRNATNRRMVIDGLRPKQIENVSALRQRILDRQYGQDEKSSDSSVELGDGVRVIYNPESPIAFRINGLDFGDVAGRDYTGTLRPPTPATGNEHAR